MKKLLSIDETGCISGNVVLHKEGGKSLEDIRTLYGFSTPPTVENVETVVMLLANEIANSCTVFNNNSQAAMHAVLLFRDLLLG